MDKMARMIGGVSNQWKLIEEAVNLLIIVYYSNIRNVNQTHLRMDGGFQCFLRFIGLANLSLTTQKPNSIIAKQQAFPKKPRTFRMKSLQLIMHHP